MHSPLASWIDFLRNEPGIGTALQSRLAPFILNSPDPQIDGQPYYIHVLYVPDYFAEYREKGDGLAAFLGTSIVAKVSLLLHGIIVSKLST